MNVHDFTLGPSPRTPRRHPRSWLVPLSLLGALLLQDGAEAHVLVPMTDLPEQCLPDLNDDATPIDEIVTAYTPDQMTITSAGLNEGGCWGYTWIQLASPPAPGRVLFPDSGVNVNSSEVDCGHTILTWGLYFKSANAGSSWVFVNGGVGRGLLVAGRCTYDPHNPPHSVGSPSFAAMPALPGEYRMAIKATHEDDPAHGHPGTACPQDGDIPGNETTCNESVKLLITSSTTWSGVFTNGDWNGTLPWDWHGGVYKGTCPPGWTQAGLSNDPSAPKPHAMLCRYVGLTKLTGEYRATLVLPNDQRRATRTVAGTTDWAWPYWKLECGLNEYVSGSSADPDGNRRFRSVMCAHAGGGLSSATCNTRVFDNFADDDGDPTNPDWDFQYWKGECGANQYLAGVSVAPANYRVHSLLCCNR